MKIFVKVKVCKKVEKVEKTGENEFEVWVKEKPVEGKANRATIEVLAEYFKVAQNRVSIVSGSKSTQKIIEIF